MPAAAPRCWSANGRCSSAPNPPKLRSPFTLLASDSAAQAGKGLKAKFASFVQAQKANAAEKVGAWVDEQQQSLMQTLKNSFNQWLRKSLGLAKM